MNELIDILEELVSIFNELDNEMLKKYSDRLNLIYSDKTLDILMPKYQYF